MTRYCRCKHAESAHNAEGLDGCFWCKCKCFKFDRAGSINANNAFRVYRAANAAPGVFGDEDKTV